MGATDQATLPYRITQDSVVLVPLVVIGLYVTLSLLRTILDYAKSGAKEKGNSINSFNSNKQDNKTPVELFRLNTGAVQYAEEISGSVPLSAQRKDVSFGSATELSNIFDGDSTGDKSLYARRVPSVSDRGENTDVPQTSPDRGNGQEGKIRGSDDRNHEIRQETRLLNTDCMFDPQTVKHILVGLTKTVIQETQKQMYSAFEQ